MELQMHQHQKTDLVVGPYDSSPVEAIVALTHNCKLKMRGRKNDRRTLKSIDTVEEAIQVDLSCFSCTNGNQTAQNFASDREVWRAACM